MEIKTKFGIMEKVKRRPLNRKEPLKNAPAGTILNIYINVDSMWKCFISYKVWFDNDLLATIPEDELIGVDMLGRSIENERER